VILALLVAMNIPTHVLLLMLMGVAMTTKLQYVSCLYGHGYLYFVVVFLC